MKNQITFAAGAESQDRKDRSDKQSDPKFRKTTLTYPSQDMNIKGFPVGFNQLLTFSFGFLVNVSGCLILGLIYHIFNRPGVAQAVLQTALSLY